VTSQMSRAKWVTSMGSRERHSLAISWGYFARHTRYAELWSSTGEYLLLFRYNPGWDAFIVGGNSGVGKEEGAQVEVADPPESYNLKSVSSLSAGGSSEVNAFSLGRVAGSLVVNNEKSN